MERNVGVVCGKNAKQQKLTVRITFIIMSQHIGENPYVSTNSDVKKRWETSWQISGRLEGEVPFKGQ